MGERLQFESQENSNDCKNDSSKYFVGYSLKIFGDTKAFDSVENNTYRIGDAMIKLCWSLNSLKNSASIHLRVTIPTICSADRFIEEITKVVNVLLLGNKGKSGKDEVDIVTMNGKAGSLPAGPISELFKSYLDVILAL